MDRLEESIASTKHIALAINEELDLHTKLIVNHQPFFLASISFVILLYYILDLAGSD